MSNPRTKVLEDAKIDKSDKIQIGNVSSNLLVIKGFQSHPSSTKSQSTTTNDKVEPLIPDYGVVSTPININTKYVGKQFRGSFDEIMKQAEEELETRNNFRI